MLVMLLCTKNIKDTQCGFKLFTKSAAKVLFKSLHLERWAFDIEIIYLAEVLHIPMKEVIIAYYVIYISYEKYPFNNVTGCLVFLYLYANYILNYIALHTHKNIIVFFFKYCSWF